MVHGQENTGSAGADTSSANVDDRTSQPGSTQESPGGAKGDSGEGSEYVRKDIFESYKTDLFKAKDALREAKEKLKGYEKEQESIREEKLLKEQKFDEVREGYQQKLKELESAVEERNRKIAEFQEQQRLGAKVNAFTSNADFSLDKKYLNHVDFDLISMDDQGNIDENTVTKAIEKFKREHPVLIKPRNSGAKYQSPNGGTQKLSKREFQKLQLERGEKWASKNLHLLE
jgi:vacuolar-type H+-ATPase subunit I/STV1